MIDALSTAARRGMQLDGGGYRREHLRAFAQHVELADDEIRIMGSKSGPLQTLVAASSRKSAGFGVRSPAPKWRGMAVDRHTPDPDDER